MRDDRKKWDVPDTFAEPLVLPGVELTRINADRQTIISAKDILLQVSDAVGWPDIAQGVSYTLVLRRDRVLVVNGEPVADGWDGDRQQAVSDATDAYAIFQLTGPRAIEILKHGAAINLAQTSDSVARIMFGIEVYLYRHDDENRFRMHVSSSRAQSLWQNLKCLVL